VAGGGARVISYGGIARFPTVSRKTRFSKKGARKNKEKDLAGEEGLNTRFSLQP